MSNWKIKVLDLEPSTQCNAACPMCARSFQGLLNTSVPVANLSVDALSTLRPYLNNLERLSMCGNYGDPILNPDLMSLIDYCISINPHCSTIIHTNGGARNVDWWQRLAQYPNLKVRFGIDGLEDTNSLYRRKVRWDILERNYRAFISAGGTAEWKMIVFGHNQHQVQACRARASQEGFSNFSYVVTNRFTQGDKTVFTMHPDAEDTTPLTAADIDFDPAKFEASHVNRTLGVYSSNAYAEEDSVKPRTSTTPSIIAQRAFAYSDHVVPAENNISCYTQAEGIVYVSAAGDLYPCCHLGYPYGGQNKYDELEWLDKSKINLYNNSSDQIFKWFDEVERRWSQSNCLGTCTKVCSTSGKPNLYAVEDL